MLLRHFSDYVIRQLETSQGAFVDGFGGSMELRTKGKASTVTTYNNPKENKGKAILAQGLLPQISMSCPDSRCALSKETYIARIIYGLSPSDLPRAGSASFHFLGIQRLACFLTGFPPRLGANTQAEKLPFDVSCPT